MNIDFLIEKFSHSRKHQEKGIFSTLFIVQNKLQTLFDKSDPYITLKQFMLVTMIGESAEQLTFTQLGTLLGCSRQNIKKLASSLEQKGFVKIEQGYYSQLVAVRRFLRFYCPWQSYFCKIKDFLVDLEFFFRMGLGILIDLCFLRLIVRGTPAQSCEARRFPPHTPFSLGTLFSIRCGKMYHSATETVFLKRL